MSEIFGWAVVLVAGFLAGGLNAIAGGGSFLTLPALVFVGVPPILANATGTAALLPGYVAGAWALRAEARGAEPLPKTLLVAVTAVAGAGGAALLLNTSEALFRELIPALLLFATAMFVLGPLVLRRWGKANQIAPPWVYVVGLLAVSVYGGYFNGGLGIMLLALLAMVGHTDINRMNGLKNIFSAVLTVIAVGVYALGDTIVWHLALPLMVATTLGGYAGGRVGRRLSPTVVRVVVVVSGLSMALLFLLQ